MENKQHVQLPRKDEIDKITPQEQLIYVSIRRHMNKDTYEAFPSLETIRKHCGASIPTIRKVIKNLESEGYLKVNKIGGKNVYKFDKLKSFEPFSYEFLDKEDLTFLEKSYILSTQQFMFKHPENKTGTCTMSTRELANKTGLSQSSVVKCQHTLMDKNYLDIITTSAKEIETGCNKREQVFHLDELGQAVVFTLMNHEEKINNINDRVTRLEYLLTEERKRNDDLEKINKIISKENRELKKKESQEPIIMD